MDCQKLLLGGKLLKEYQEMNLCDGDTIQLVEDRNAMYLNGWNSYIYAAAHYSVAEAVSFLIEEAEESIDTKSELLELTPLCAASKENVVELLMGVGAPTHVDEWYAEYFTNPSCLKSLLAGGVDFEWRERENCDTDDVQTLEIVSEQQEKILSSVISRIPFPYFPHKSPNKPKERFKAERFAQVIESIDPIGWSSTGWLA